MSEIAIGCTERVPQDRIITRCVLATEQAQSFSYPLEDSTHKLRNLPMTLYRVRRSHLE